MTQRLDFVFRFFILIRVNVNKFLKKMRLREEIVLISVVKMAERSHRCTYWQISAQET